MAHEKYIGDPAALRAWQERMGFTNITAAEALDMTRSAYAAMIAVNVQNPKNRSRISLRTALACAAIEHGVKPI
jgi:hypothetical protein